MRLWQSKLLRNKEKEELEREYDFLSSFDHPNIIKPHIFVHEAKIRGEDDKKALLAMNYDEDSFDFNVGTYFTLKFYENGDLFENVSRGGPVHEGIARYYFTQLINAVEYLHLRNVAHRDIKLDNILLDDNFQLMLIDFGFAEELSSKVSDKFIDFGKSNVMGTKGYISPEQISNDGNEPIGLKKGDIFALGVVLFILLKGTAPFEAPTREDKYYQHFLGKSKNTFWKLHQSKTREFQNKAFSILSYEVKNLVNGLLNPDPSQRPDISEIKEHLWFSKSEMLSDEEIKKLMSERTLK